MKKILLGNEAVALGANEAGVKVVSSYPGTPSTEITEAAAGYARIYCEWAPNEKVGLEVAVGASIAGSRAMSCMKHVGLNVAADPLFTASYTGVNGGLVIVVADDPGMHSSQNEQDSRHYARAAKLPMLEPADSNDCRNMTREAFSLSEKYDTPVMIRLTTRIAHSRSLVEELPLQEQQLKKYEKDMNKYVMMPAMAVGRHKAVEARMERLGRDAGSAGMHQVLYRSEKIGVICSGISWQYVREALPQASVLKLGMIWPLPLDLIREFARKVEKLVVVEELDPFLETEIRAAGIECTGKEHFTLLGEYSAQMISSRLGADQAAEPAVAGELQAAPGRPPVMCAGCSHRGLFMALKRLKAIVTGDIGCYTLGALSPNQAMDTCVCMGASVGMAHGFDKGTDGALAKRTVAVIGDSTFLHSGVTGLINCVYNKSDCTILILDNSITGMTGHQQNPSTGMDIRLQPAPSIDLEALCRVIGVDSVRVIRPSRTWEAEKIIAEEMARDGVSVVIARQPCALIPTGKGRPEDVVVLIRDDCTKCGACIRIMCPALTRGPDGYPVIDPVTCNGCGLCMEVCRFDALKKKGDMDI